MTSVTTSNECEKFHDPKKTIGTSKASIGSETTKKFRKSSPFLREVESAQELHIKLIMGY